MPTKLIIALAASLTLGVATATEEKAANDKKAVESLIRDLYLKKFTDIEAWSGRSAGERACNYLKSIFDERLITKGNATPCQLAPGAVRFPTIASEDHPDLVESKRTPKFKLVGSSVNDDLAVVKVNAPIDSDLPKGRVVFFLRQTGAGWRIVNLLSYQRWPLRLPERQEDGPCPRPPDPTFEFAHPPTGPAQLEDIPSPCREALVQSYNRTGWGK